MNANETPASVHRFWFGDDADDATTAARQSKLWWGKDNAVDRTIRDRFGPWIERAAAEELSDWTKSPAGLLALVLLTDQFPRNAFRGTPRAFAFDSLARAWSRALLASRGLDSLRLVERVFALLPLEHAESIADQDECVARMREVHAAATPAFRDTTAGYVDFAIRHRDIIARFGRFPHRNAILGRDPTPEEATFLLTPGSGF